MSLLAGIQDTVKRNIPSRICEVIAYKTGPSNQKQIVAKDLVTNKVVTIEQLPAREGLKHTRNTIEMLENSASTKHAPVGAHIRIDDVQETEEGKYKISFIRTLSKGLSDPELSIGMAIARPLPCAKEASHAWVECLLTSQSESVQTAEQFWKGLFSCYKKALQHRMVPDESKVRFTVNLTDGPNTEPIRIFANDVLINPENKSQGYRKPNPNELAQQFRSQQIVQQVMDILKNTNGNHTIQLTPGLRIYVPPKAAASDEYQYAIRNHTATFKVMHDNRLIEREVIGFRYVGLGFYQSMVSNLKPMLNEMPTLNGRPDSVASKAGKSNINISSQETRNLAGAAAATAAEAFDSVDDAPAAQTFVKETTIDNSPIEPVPQEEIKSEAKVSTSVCDEEVDPIEEMMFSLKEYQEQDDEESQIDKMMNKLTCGM